MTHLVIRPGLTQAAHEVWDVVNASDSPMDAHEIAAKLGKHVTTVRFHLGRLQDLKLITVASLPRGSAGRPRMVYTATHPAPVNPFQELATVLSVHFGDPSSRVERAVQAGRDWANDLLSEPSATDAEDATSAIVDFFEQMQFSPTVEKARSTPKGRSETQPDRQRVLLSSCPFGDLARDQPDVVCSVHRGLLQGLLNRLGQAGDDAELATKVQPNLCIASWPRAS